jgi:hypothetical protein
MQHEVYLSAAMDDPGWIRTYASARGREEFARIFGRWPEWSFPMEGHIVLASPRRGRERLYGWGTCLMRLQSATTVEEAENCLEQLGAALREQGCSVLTIGPTCMADRSAAPLMC